MALAHCPGVLLPPARAEPSFPGTAKAGLCCQITGLSISQLAELLNVQFQSPVFL